jgi:hypothetical protein
VAEKSSDRCFPVDLARARARRDRELGDLELGLGDAPEVRGDVATVGEAAAGMGLAR